MIHIHIYIYITTSEFNKLTAENFTVGLKQAHLAAKTDFDNKLTSFNKRIASNKSKHLEVQNKLDSLITKGYNFFLGRIYFTSNDEPQNMFVYQPIFSVLELKIDKDTEYIIGWKSKGVCNSKFISLHGAFLPKVKFFGNKIGIQFNNASLVIEQNHYKSRTGNVYIVYDLDC